MRNYTKSIENLLFDFLFGVGFGVGGGCITAGEVGGGATGGVAGGLPPLPRLERNVDINSLAADDPFSNRDFLFGFISSIEIT